MGKTTIAWCDYTWNPWRGCARVSAGCQNCYAETFSKRNPAVLGQWGPQGTRVLAATNYWKLPRTWNGLAAELGIRIKVFCASLADVFEDWKGQLTTVDGRETGLTLAGARELIWATIHGTPHLDWLLLTKRPENVLQMTPLAWGRSGWPRNVWIGVSVEDQKTADARLPWLAKFPASVRFVSYEPALGPVDFGPHLEAIDWLILGGESGHGARPCALDWLRAAVDACNAAAVSPFVKQLGAHPRALTGTGVAEILVLHHKKGEDPSEWPPGLQVQAFPTPRF